MNETQMVHEIDVARPPTWVFACVSDAHTWPAWHPTTVSVVVPDDGPARAGHVIRETVRVGPVRGLIVWTVLEADPGRRYRIQGEVDFPLMRRTRADIVYDLAPTVMGHTHLRRDLRYASPLRTSQLADRLYLRGHNDRQSRVALHRLKLLAERQERPPA